MWLRRNADWASLLTLGNTTHISDPRYSVSFQYPNNWRLAIAGVRREDRGLYVCQVNTHPPRMLVTNVTVLGNHFLLIRKVFNTFEIASKIEKGFYHGKYKKIIKRQKIQDNDICIKRVYKVFGKFFFPLIIVFVEYVTSMSFKLSVVKSLLENHLFSFLVILIYGTFKIKNIRMKKLYF